MTAVADPLLYQGRPRFQIDGEERDDLSDGLIALQIEDDQDGMSRCEATFANWGTGRQGLGFLYFDRRLLDFGKTIRIAAGGGVGAGLVFDGRITALEGRFIRERPHEILVLAEDRLQGLRMSRRTRVFADVDDAAIFQQVASDHGLTAKVDVTGPQHRVIAQVNQSDLAFLRERARAVDAEVSVSGSTLRVTARSRRNSGDVVLTWGRGLLQLSVAADLARQVSKVIATGWDVSAKKGIAAPATASALAAELGKDVSGSRILEQALGARTEQVIHLAPATTDEARALAEAQFRRTARRFVTGLGLAEGDARIRIGAHVELRGVGPLFEGRYYVTGVRHIFDGAYGFQTQFAVERPGIGAGNGAG